MSRSDPLLRLRHMYDYASEAIELLGDQSAEEVESNRVLQLALVRLVEIVGEAASQVPADFRELHPNLPWREASSMCNLLIHGYDIIRIDILVNTIREDLGALARQLQAILGGDVNDT
ncbi:MAG: HepT-like ribonuclease domain-containing protein [Planctomycetota bacterium]